MTETAAQIGLSLPNRAVLFGALTYGQMLEMAEAADQSPFFHSVWVGDSLIAKPRPDSVVLLSGLAARTRRVKLGPACMASFNLRHPIVFAAQWATLDAFSGGRTLLAVCIGGPTGPGSGGGEFQVEMRAMGSSLKERVGRMEEGIAILRMLWTTDRASFAGRYYQFAEVNIAPRPVQNPVPIWIASSPNPDLIGAERFRRALARVATLADGWMTALITPQEFRHRWQLIREMAVSIGRNADALGFSQHIMVNIGANERGARAEAKRFLDAYYATSFSDDELSRWGSFGPPEHVTNRLQAYIEAGCQLPIVRFVTWDPIGQLNRCLKEVLPHLRAAGSSTNLLPPESA